MVIIVYIEAMMSSKITPKGLVTFLSTILAGKILKISKKRNIININESVIKWLINMIFS